MIDFEYHAPTSLVQVFDLLDQYGEDARAMAGGTALVIQMKQRLSQPGHIVGLRGVEGLNSIESTSEGIKIGALCTQREIENNIVIAEDLPLLVDTFRKVATPRIRNMATIGGGLVNGDPSQDPPPSGGGGTGGSCCPSGVCLGSQRRHPGRRSLPNGDGA